VYIGDDSGGVIAPRGSIEVGFECVLGLKPRDIGPDLGITPMLREKFPDPGPRIAEQRLVDEVDGCGRSLDVQQDGADFRQRDAVFRIGM
jgi:hypothetical protein